MYVGTFNFWLFSAEYHEQPSLNASSTPTREWVVNDMAIGNQLGTEERVKKKQDMITSTGIYIQIIEVILAQE